VAHSLIQGMGWSACLELQLGQQQLILATEGLSLSEVQHVPARPMGSGQVLSQAAEVGGVAGGTM